MDRAKARKRAEELVDRMTVEEMASQLKFDAEGIERLGIPSYNWWNEALHGVARNGVATVFPQAIGLAASFDTDLMYGVGECIAEEGRAKYNAAVRINDRNIYKGLTFWSPNVNIFRDPRWGRGHETYGEDPYLTSRMAVPFIKGIQGDGEYMKAAACAKHFAVHSGPEAKRHSFDAKVSKKDLEDTYLPAFEACVTEGKVEAVMGAYNRTNGEPCCANKPLMVDTLRGKWGFEGHFVSDCWAVKDFHENHHVTATPEESVKLALETGCDLNCGCTYEKVMNAYNAGMLDEKYIRESCIRLFTTRFLLGMFDETEYDKIPYSSVDCEAHRALASRATLESAVLLKNDGILPVDIKKTKTIGVIGPNADSRAALLGNYHGYPGDYVTILEGIKEYAGDDTRVLFAQGCDLFRDIINGPSYGDIPDGFAEARAVMDESDVIILVMGLDETLEGEEGDAGNAWASGDKRDLAFPESQQKLMDMVLLGSKPVVFLNVTGSAMDLREAKEKAGAVMQVFYPGGRGGREIAKLIFGESSPSGKLPLTFYNSADDLPEFEDYSMENRTYRYFKGDVLYPFGWGLTYGDCAVNYVSVEKSEKDGSFDGVKVSVNVENKGRDTGEVLQVYIRSDDDENAVPNVSLCGFERIYLKKGERCDVTVEVDRRAFTSVDENGERAIRGKKFRIFAGFCQPSPEERKGAGVEIDL